MDKSDFFVGQEVYLLKYRNGKEGIVKATVTSIGRKYITADGHIRFDMINNFKGHEPYRRYGLYLSEREAQREAEKGYLLAEIRMKIDSSSRLKITYTLEQLQEVLRILEESADV